MALIYDGFDLTRYALVRIERPVGPSMRVTTEQIPGRAGELALSAEPDVSKIVAHCTLRRRYYDAWRHIRIELADVFSRSGERILELPSEPGRYRLASASLSGNVMEPLEPPVTFDIEFTLHDPYGYGPERTAIVPSAGTALITIGGTRPSRINVSAAAATRDSTTHLWGLIFDDSLSLHVELPSGAQSVDIDCENRSVLVSSATSMITLSSLWPTLDPGMHTVQMNRGTGAAEITWTERYV